jgi:hypothetical protein
VERRQTAALNIDVYLAGLVHHRDELEMQEQRARRIAHPGGADAGDFAQATLTLG